MGLFALMSDEDVVPFASTPIRLKPETTASSTIRDRRSVSTSLLIFLRLPYFWNTSFLKSAHTLSFMYMLTLVNSIPLKSFTGKEYLRFAELPCSCKSCEIVLLGYLRLLTVLG